MAEVILLQKRGDASRWSPVLTLSADYTERSVGHEVFFMMVESPTANNFFQLSSRNRGGSERIWKHTGFEWHDLARRAGVPPWRVGVEVDQRPSGDAQDNRQESWTEARPLHRWPGLRTDSSQVDEQSHGILRAHPALRSPRTPANQAR